VEHDAPSGHNNRPFGRENPQGPQEARRRLAARTAGASGAFIRELLRKAAVFAAEDAPDGAVVVRPPHLEEALTDLVVAGGSLTHSLLGSSRPATNS